MTLSNLQWILFLNGCFLMGFIFLQNDNTKDSTNGKRTNTTLNPLEIVTWSSLSIQLVVLLLQAKNTNF
jgi:hypothetical protein